MIELLDHEPDMQSFSCGVPSIDNMISEAYLNHLIRKSMTFQIKILGHNVGYYQLVIANVTMEGTELPFGDYGSGENRYGVLSIRFLAIKKEIQKKGIGTLVLREILKEARELSTRWPIRVVYIEALPDKVPWYREIGFEILKDASDDNFGLVPMFFEMMSTHDKESIEDYCSSQYTQLK